MGDGMVETTMPYDERNDETGRFDPTYTAEDFIDALRAGDGRLTTQEVREAVGCAYRTAHARLTDLEDDGRVASRDVGRAKLWTLTDGDATTPAMSAADPAEESNARGAAGGNVSREDAPESVDAVIGGLDLPGSGSKLDARREAVRAAVEHLRENGTATPAEFKSDVYPDHPARHTEGEDPANAWWKRTVSTGLKQVAERTEAVEPADTSGVWRWAGSDGE